MVTWVSALLVFVAVVLVTIAGAILFEWLADRRRQRQVEGQLELLSRGPMEQVAPGAASLFRQEAAAQSQIMRVLAARVPHVRDLEHRLEQAALDWSPQSFLLLCVGLAFAAGLGALLFTGKVLVATVPAAFGAVLPWFYLRRRCNRRLGRFEEQFPEAIDLLGRAIRAGHPLSSGLKMVADESEDPVAGEFRRVFEEQRFGLPFDDSVTALADRVPLADVRIFVTALLIQREVGGNLAEILDNLSTIIRQRFILRRDVQTLTAEGRLSGYVLTGLPIGIGLWVLLANPSYIMILFEHPIGIPMVAGAAVMQIIGYLWMRRITNIEF
jgi:tight adherence protein B